MTGQDNFNACIEYCHIDREDIHALSAIERLCTAAERYLTNAGAVQTSGNRELYQSALCGLVLSWFDGEPLFAGTQTIINQLKQMPAEEDAP